MERLDECYDAWVAVEALGAKALVHPVFLFTIALSLATRKRLDLQETLLLLCLCLTHDTALVPKIVKREVLELRERDPALAYAKEIERKLLRWRHQFEGALSCMEVMVSIMYHRPEAASNSRTRVAACADFTPKSVLPKVLSKPLGCNV